MGTSDSQSPIPERKRRKVSWGPMGYVYFVLCTTTKLVKIGWSINHPDGRLTQFRLGSGSPLERLGYIRDDQTLERRLHAKFKHLREHGEWFRFEDALFNYIEENASPWHMKKRSSREDHEQFKASRDNYEETAQKLMWEWTQNHCPDFSRDPNVKHVNFFEFCLQRGFRFKRSDRAMVKMVNGKATIYYYEYVD